MVFHTRDGEQYKLTNEDIIHYSEKGYVVLENVISEDELAFIENWFDHFIAGSERHCMARDFCDMSQPYGTPIENFQLINAMLPSKYRPELANNIFHRVAQNITDQLYTQGKALLDYEQFLAKKAKEKGAEFAMHQDLGYWPKTPNTWTATFSLAITPSTIENGCLQVIPGSNKEPELRKHVPKPYSNSNNTEALEKVSRDDSHLLVIDTKTGDRVQHLPVSRGSVTVHDERIIHGSSGNLSDDWRKTYVMAFRDKETIKQERAAGFTHSHNDNVNWNEFIS
jgi:ectoine hydroxylase-related dioxygenase (phytanoyl-CoA dioxygenase family)